MSFRLFGMRRTYGFAGLDKVLKAAGRGFPLARMTRKAMVLTAAAQAHLTGDKATVKVVTLCRKDRPFSSEGW